MFRSSHTRQWSGQGAYSRLQQQDEDEDLDYEELLEEIAHHPNAILFEASDGQRSVLPSQPAPLPELPAEPLPRESLSSHLPEVTRRFFKSRLPFGQGDIPSASSITSVHPVILADIQHGHMPTRADPLLKEMGSRGWTIVRRRRRRRKRKQPTAAVEASVFVKCDPSSPPVSPVKDDKNEPILVNLDTYVTLVDDTRSAIDDGLQPIRISQGSSGSYFCRDRHQKVVGVFKPKNEEPYGRLNPKWTKWIHRHLFPCCFGRSCLIPNLGYLSEAAASLVDRRVGTCIVPRTHVAHLASPAFHYDYLDRRADRLPPKIGSFQCFLHNFKDANLFLRDNPLLLDTSTSTRFSQRASVMWGGCLGQSSDDEDDDDEVDEVYLDMDDRTDRATASATTIRMTSGPGDEREALTSEGDECSTCTNQPPPSSPLRHTSGSPMRSPARRSFRWTVPLQQQFKAEFERLVILDYLIRNTDRGLDNWMIRYCDDDSGRCESAAEQQPANSSSASINSANTAAAAADSGYFRRLRGPHLHIAAIDNGLAFPFKHPDEWRSYPYGWLALPEVHVARPFSDATRKQFLPLLSDPVWWQSTVKELRDLFSTDADFNERMFSQQIAVIKGQGFNLVRALRDPQAGPLDLVAMERVLVHEEEILIEYDDKILQQRMPKEAHGRLLALPRDNVRPKRSTSFDGHYVPPSVAITMDRTPFQHAAPATTNTTTTTAAAAAAPSSRPPWQDRVKNRLSLDLGHRQKPNTKRRSRRRLFRRVGSDGELGSGMDSDSNDEHGTRHQLIMTMETIKVIKSRKPYFSCC